MDEDDEEVSDAKKWLIKSWLTSMIFADDANPNDSSMQDTCKSKPMTYIKMK